MPKSTQGTPTPKTAVTFPQSTAVKASPTSTQESLQDTSQCNMPGPHALPQQPNDARLPLAMIRYLREPARAGGPVYSVILEASRALDDVQGNIHAIDSELSMEEWVEEWGDAQGGAKTRREGEGEEEVDVLEAFFYYVYEFLTLTSVTSVTPVTSVTSVTSVTPVSVSSISAVVPATVTSTSSLT